MKIPLYKTVLHTHEQKFSLHCASHVCYTQQIKLDCVTDDSV